MPFIFIKLKIEFQKNYDSQIYAKNKVPFISMSCVVSQKIIIAEQVVREQ
jgi:hypothetical protein